MPEPIPTDPASWAVQPLSVSVPPDERRNRVAVVRMAEKVLSCITIS